MFLFNKGQNNSTGTSSSNLKSFETQYKTSSVPEKQALIQIGEKIYNCPVVLFQDTKIVQITENKIPTIKSTENASIIKKGVEQISINPIIDLGAEVATIIENNSQGNKNYYRAFPTIDLETTIIENNVAEAQIPSNLPTGLYKTSSGKSGSALFYYQQENEENSKELFELFEQYKGQEIELLRYKRTAETKINDKFGYLNLLVPTDTEIYQIENSKITGKQTTTKQEVEANFAYGNTSLASAKSDILFSNGKLYYSIRLTGGEVISVSNHWSSNVAVNYETLKQLIETALENNFEHNTHKTQNQNDVYIFE